MSSRSRSRLRRAAAAALLAAGSLAAGGLAGGAPAQAAADTELVLHPLSTQLAKGVREANAKPFKFIVSNLGESAATDVKITVDVSGLDHARVGWLVPDGCAAAAERFTCDLADLAANSTGEFGVPLFSLAGKGPAGTLKVTLTSAATGDDPADNTAEVPITVTRPGFDLTTWTQDVYADVVVDGDDRDETGLTPVAPGGTAPLDWAVYNHGSRRATGIFYGFTLPVGVTFAELPEGCVTEERDGVVSGYCEEPERVLRPGEFLTHPVKVKVAGSAAPGTLTPGALFAVGLEDVPDTGQAPGVAAAGEPASETQRRTYEEADPGDLLSLFDVFVAAPVPPGDDEPPADGGGGGGGLPVTGVQAGVVGGVGLAVVVAGVLLFLTARRRRVVLVTPADERSTD